jgi:conjugative relaxase-like TrwC/TraI family protein
VLSIGKMVAGSEDYYLNTVAQGREEYYTGSGEAPGQWLGAGANDLGLIGQVAPDDLRSVLAGVAPDGRVLTAGRVRPEGRVSGFDLTFSAPKSVSLLYGLCDPSTTEVVRRVHAEAVADALSYLERRALQVRRGAGGERRLGAEGLIAAGFQHRTSRAGDPQLHTHVLVANATLGADGTWSAPDARLLYFHARTAGFLYQAALRSGLTRSLGVRFGRVENGSAEVEGISPAVLKAFSTRRAEIERHMATAGTTSARGAEVAALITRSPKGLELDHGLEGPVDLHQRWRARADDLGTPNPGPIGVLNVHTPERVDQLDTEALVAELTGPDGLCASDSSFERRDVVRAVASRLIDGGSVAEVERVADLVLASPEVVPLASIGPGGELRHTTDELLSIETALIDTAVSHSAPVPGTGVGLVDQEKVEAVLERFPLLAEDQRSMVRRLTSSGAGVEVVVGRAGSGKTTALAASRRAWDGAGTSVIGAALSARAAQGLEGGAGIPSTTIARLLGNLDTGAVTLDSNHVLVVDEAGMVGTRQLGRLLSRASEAGAKVVLVGDPRQLPEIEAGGAVSGLIERLGAIELTGNHRQQAAWERSALDELRHGNPVTGLAAFEHADRVHLAPSMAEARAQLVEAWFAARAGGDRGIMLAATRDDVAALNQLGRTSLRKAGQLGPDVTELGGIGFALGDRVVLLRNDTALKVVNGTEGELRAVSDQEITVSTEHGHRVLPLSFGTDGYLTHGYATTIHKAQGLTVDRAFLLATDALTREAGYVAMSRARLSTELFVPTSSFEDGLPVVGVDEPDPMHAVGKRFLISRAKQLATDDLSSPFSEDRLPLPDTRTAPAAFERAERPEDRYLVPMLGQRPAFLEERAEYDTVAWAISSYRDRFAIDSDEALGDRPLEAHQRSDYEKVRTQVRTYQRRQGLSLELDGHSRGRNR